MHWSSVAIIKDYLVRIKPYIKDLPAHKYATYRNVHI